MTTRRELLKGAAAACTPSLLAEAKAQTLALETYARRSLNYYDRMVDRNGLPYFNIFLTNPPEAAHDWPDFGDVTSRQYQAVIMVRRMTGETSKMETVWRRMILALIDPETGLLVRPQTPYSEKMTSLDDQGLTLYALATAYLDRPDEEMKRAVSKMVDGLRRGVETNPKALGMAAGGFMIKSLMAAGRATGYQPAFGLARDLAMRVMAGGLFTEDNRFRSGAHVHGWLRTLVGLADYALYAKDDALFRRIDAIYRYLRSEVVTRFGFLPEVLPRKGDVVATETCAIMDYLGVAATLANHGYPAYWADVERTARNHLIESQARDLSWVKPGSRREDTDEFSWRDIPSRMEGAYAGWSSPNHFLAAEEMLHWGGPKLRGKIRLFQNCCGGSGTHAFYIAWRNAARFQPGTLSVRLHIDKLLPEAEVRGFQPYRGLTAITLRAPCNIRVRVPEFVESARALQVRASGTSVPFEVDGSEIVIERRPAGERIEVRYPLPVRSEEVSVGNPGFRQYRYRVTWKGDTVVKMEPLGNDVKTGYSDFEKRQVPVYYGKEGPGVLYRREAMLQAADPALSALHADDGPVDFWAGLEG